MLWLRLARQQSQDPSVTLATTTSEQLVEWIAYWKMEADGFAELIKRWDRPEPTDWKMNKFMMRTAFGI